MKLLSVKLCLWLFVKHTEYIVTPAVNTTVFNKKVFWSWLHCNMLTMHLQQKQNSKHGKEQQPVLGWLVGMCGTICTIQCDQECVSQQESNCKPTQYHTWFHMMWWLCASQVEAPALEWLVLVLLVKVVYAPVLWEQVVHELVWEGMQAPAWCLLAREVVAW